MIAVVTTGTAAGAIVSAGTADALGGHGVGASWVCGGAAGGVVVAEAGVLAADAVDHRLSGRTGGADAVVAVETRCAAFPPAPNLSGETTDAIRAALTHGTAASSASRLSRPAADIVRASRSGAAALASAASGRTFVTAHVAFGTVPSAALLGGRVAAKGAARDLILVAAAVVLAADAVCVALDAALRAAGCLGEVAGEAGLGGWAAGLVNALHTRSAALLVVPNRQLTFRTGRLAAGVVIATSVPVFDTVSTGSTTTALVWSAAGGSGSTTSVGR